MQEVLQYLRIRKTWTTLLHMESRWQSEWCENVADNHLRKDISEYQRDCNEMLPIFLLTDRSSTHKAQAWQPAWCLEQSYIYTVTHYSGLPQQTAVHDWLQDGHWALATWYPALHLSTPEGGHQQDKHPLWAPGQFCRISGRRPSPALPSDLMKRKSPKLQPFWEGLYKILDTWHNTIIRNCYTESLLTCSSRIPLKRHSQTMSFQTFFQLLWTAWKIHCNKDKSNN